MTDTTTKAEDLLTRDQVAEMLDIAPGSVAGIMRDAGIALRHGWSASEVAALRERRDPANAEPRRAARGRRKPHAVRLHDTAQ